MGRTCVRLMAVSVAALKGSVGMERRARGVGKGPQGVAFTGSR